MKLASIIAGKGGFVVTAQPDTTVAELLTLLAENRIGALVVSVDGRTIAGIVSERDVVRSLADGPGVLQSPVSSIMTAQVYCAPADAHVDELMHLMTDKRIRHVPVVDDDGLLIGIVSIGDVVKTRLGELEGERAALMSYITTG
jgi:CBS domain-containing protein